MRFVPGPAETRASHAIRSGTWKLGQDHWERGTKLLEYQVLGEGEAKDANLSIKVKLTLAGDKPATKTTEKTVSYLVGTSPSVTVFRDMFKR